MFVTLALGLCIDVMKNVIGLYPRTETTDHVASHQQNCEGSVPVCLVYTLCAGRKKELNSPLYMAELSLNKLSGIKDQRLLILFITFPGGWVSHQPIDANPD